MIILFEGLDRTGKDTQIELLKTYYAKLNNPYHILHYSAVKDLKNGILLFSKIYYHDMFDMLNYMNGEYNLILNRAHLGEHVYGKIYRNYDGSYVFDLEKKYQNLINTIFLFVFIDKPENLVARDDGNSFSTMIEKKSMEIEKFK
jgi:thymidylate kinase